MAELMTITGLRDYIKLQLGHPVAVVELSDQQLDQAINNALMTFNHWMCEARSTIAFNRSGHIKFELGDDCRGVCGVKFLLATTPPEESIPVQGETSNHGDGTALYSGVTRNRFVRKSSFVITGGSNRVTDDANGKLVGDIQSDADSNFINYGTGQYSVHFKDDVATNSPIIAQYQYSSTEDTGGPSEAAVGAASSNINIFEILYRVVFPRFPVADWYLYRSFYDMFQSVRGTEPDWKWNPSDKSLYLDCSGGPFDVYIAASYDLSLAGFSQEKPAYKKKFLDLVMVEAKKILIEIRGKFGSIPAPGGTITTNVSETRTTLEKTEETIINWLKVVSRAPTSIMMG